MGVITAPTGAGGAPVALYLAVAAPQPTTTQFNLATTDWYLADTTGNLEPRTAHRTCDLRTVYWRTFSGAPNRYFAIPDTRVAHSLFAGFPAGGWTAMSAGPVVWTYGAYPNNQPVSLHYFVGLAPAMGENMDASLYLVDRTDNRKTPWAQTDVRASADWVFDPDYLTFPLVQVRVTMEACEVGHTFTVHSRLPNLPERLTPCAAQAGTAGAGELSFAVGAGLQFWITRDAENGSTPQRMAPATGTWAAGTNPAQVINLSAVGRFPAPPMRGPLGQLVPHQFRIKTATRLGHTFSVRMSDGYTTFFNTTAHADAATNSITPAYGQATITSLNSQPLANPLQVYTFTAMIDPTRGIVLRDESIAGGGGLAAEITVDPAVNPTDVFDGWVPPMAAGRRPRRKSPCKCPPRGRIMSGPCSATRPGSPRPIPGPIRSRTMAGPRPCPRVKG